MLEYKSLNELVYEEIKKRIVTRYYQPGERLDVDQIASEFQVSRTPITNSLKALERDGYVTIIQRSGTYVRKYSKEEIEALFDFRAALEEVVVSKAIKNADPINLKRFINSFEGCIKNLSIDSLADKMKYFDEMQSDFHSYLWKLCPTIIYNETQNVMLLTRQITARHINFYIHSPFALEFAKNEINVHIDIARAILNKDEEKARASIRSDILGSKEDILAHFEEIEATENSF
ncbi:MAG: GntR family transcriptional regulator [Lawsonibacter sp.]|jgi:DNA-binding GntR family transcriptional regulator